VHPRLLKKYGLPKGNFAPVVALALPDINSLWR
jgi:hypothetical protein